MNKPDLDTALLCLSAISCFHQLPVDPRQLAREYSHGQPLADHDILRAGKQLGFRVRHVGASFMAPGDPVAPGDRATPGEIPVPNQGAMAQNQGAINRAPTAPPPRTSR